MFYLQVRQNNLSISKNVQKVQSINQWTDWDLLSSENFLDILSFWKLFGLGYELYFRSYENWTIYTYKNRPKIYYIWIIIVKTVNLIQTSTFN